MRRAHSSSPGTSWQGGDLPPPPWRSPRFPLPGWACRTEFGLPLLLPGRSVGRRHLLLPVPSPGIRTFGFGTVAMPLLLPGHRKPVAPPPPPGTATPLRQVSPERCAGAPPPPRALRRNRRRLLSSPGAAAFLPILPKPKRPIRWGPGAFGISTSAIAKAGSVSPRASAPRVTGRHRAASRLSAAH